MKNIEQLKAKSEKGQKIAAKSFKATVKDLALLKNEKLKPYERPFYQK